MRKTALGVSIVFVVLILAFVPRILRAALHISGPDEAAAAQVQQVDADALAATGEPASELRIPILIYHSVHPSRAGETEIQKKMNVTPELFGEQLAYLRESGYTAISMDMFEVFLRAGTSTVAKPIVITFDDGWQNQYEHAFPLLRHYGMTATFYVYTSPLGKDARFMTWEEVKELAAAGIVIGSHTRTHPYLQQISEERLRAEIFESKAILEAQLGRPIVHFASPFGYSDAHIAALAQEAGYHTARTAYQGTQHTWDERYRLTGYFAPQTMREFEWILQDAP